MRNFNFFLLRIRTNTDKILIRVHTYVIRIKLLQRKRKLIKRKVRHFFNVRRVLLITNYIYFN